MKHVKNLKFLCVKNLKTFYVFYNIFMFCLNFFKLFSIYKNYCVVLYLF